MPNGVVYTSAWLQKQGYSLELQRKYRESGWLESLGSGAQIKAHDDVDFLGAVHTLQSQALLPLVIGGETALSLARKLHYPVMGKPHLRLFSPGGVRIPAWFAGRDWGVTVHHYRSVLLPSTIATEHYQHKTYNVVVSSAERALLECTHFAKHPVEMDDLLELFDGMVWLRPNVIQQCLGACRFKKTKQLFARAAKQTCPPWLSEVNLEA